MLRQKLSEIEIDFYLEIITCSASLYIMDNSKINVTNQKKGCHAWIRDGDRGSRPPENSQKIKSLLAKLDRFSKLPR